jgi:hypothetical protein
MDVNRLTHAIRVTLTNQHILYIFTRLPGALYCTSGAFNFWMPFVQNIAYLFSLLCIQLKFYYHKKEIRRG